MPDEEGGPIARTGFSYQDEIAVRLLICMLEDSQILKIHCETQDDIVVVRQVDGDAHRSVEYVQVKAGETDSLWSVANVCARDKKKVGSSIAEISLGRDRCKEISKFRIVTLRDVVSELRPLTYDFSAPGRAADTSGMKKLLNEFRNRIGDFTSPKGNGYVFWLENCIWEVCHSQKSVERDNLLRLIKLAQSEGHLLLPEQLDVVQTELRSKAKIAGDLKWGKDGPRKIITRDHLREWWIARTTEIFEGASDQSGGKLKTKMQDAKLSGDQIALAIELRREYAEETRTPKYLDTSDVGRLQRRARSEITTLRAQYLAGELALNPSEFYALCITRMDEISAELNVGEEDQSAFLKGCLYDIADRCLLRFTGASA
ncbi:MAG: dsDNA nuclease domain-containing protein [Paracoccaceae bacterium]